MNKKKVVITIIVTHSIVATFVASILCAILLPLLSANEIYQDNLKSVVELKASSDNVGESFDTAEFIDKDGTPDN